MIKHQENVKVCIAEKPSVAKEIAQVIGAKNRRDGYYEGNGYAVTWTFGHLCALQEPGEYTDKWRAWDLSVLPMIPSTFRIKLIDDDGIRRQFGIIEGLFRQAEEIINCGDAGQEGELIQRWVMTKARAKAPVKRLWISSLTEEAIREGFAHLMDASDFDTLYAAGSARAIGDWLLGMNATRAYTLRHGNGRNVLSIGRVQTPTLALIVERQRAIEQFRPERYWEVRSNYRGGWFAATRGRFPSREEAEAFLRDIEGRDMEIKTVDRKRAMEHPPKLFDLTSLQVECNRKYAFSADQTLRLIQSLYERKLTTYPRVDTTFLPNDIYPKAPAILRGLAPYAALTAPLLAAPKLRKSAKVFNDKKITDHHAIIPTGVFTMDMSPDEKRVYDLVARRFIAIFYPDCEVAATTVLATVGPHDFKATGKQVVDPAWRLVIPASKQGDDAVLPAYQPGEHGPHAPEIQEKETQPPKYYTEADLLRAMETAGKQVDDEELRELLKENGIGRPSTRAGIIETLLKRQYIRKDKKRLLATVTGIQLIDTIRDDLLKSAELTGQWERKLRMIEAGTYRVADFMEELKVKVNELVYVVKGSPRRAIPVETPPPAVSSSPAAGKKQPKTPSAGKKNPSKAPSAPAPSSPAEPLACPKCGEGRVVKGRRAWGCTRYGKGCDFLIPIEVQGKTLTPKQVEALVRRGRTGKLSGFRADDGTTFPAILRLDSDFRLLVDKK